MEPVTVDATTKILSFLIELYLWLSIGFLGYILRIQLSRVALADWLKQTWHMVLISYLFGALVCSALVISQNAAEALGSLGFNADQGMFAIGFAIVGMTIGAANLIAGDGKNKEE